LQSSLVAVFSSSCSWTFKHYITPRTPAPSTADSQEEQQQSEGSKHTIELGAPGNTIEEERLVELAESIHINPPVMTMMTEIAREQIINEEREFNGREAEETINEHTGHHIR